MGRSELARGRSGPEVLHLQGGSFVVNSFTSGEVVRSPRFPYLVVDVRELEKLLSPELNPPDEVRETARYGAGPFSSV